MNHFVYIVLCADQTFYIGYTTDLERRVIEHNGEGKTKVVRSAGARYTRARRPVTLIYHESFETKSEAMKRESVLKKLSRAQKKVLVGMS